MGKEILMFANIEIGKDKFYGHESPILAEDKNTEKELVSKKIFSGEKNYKYFIGYLYDDYKVKPLHIMPPKMRLQVKCYDEQTKWMDV